MSTPLLSKPAALSIPEVVFLVLSSLPLWELRQSASFVCREWYLLARPLLHRRDFHWLGKIPFTGRHLLETIGGNIQTLPMVSSSCYYVRPSRTSSWGRLQGQLQELKRVVKNPEEFFNELIIAGNITMDLMNLEPVTIFAAGLRSVRIENTWMETIHMEVIFETCLALECLDVGSTFRSAKADLPQGQASSEWRGEEYEQLLPRENQLAKLVIPGQIRVTKLKRVSLRRVTVELKLLEQLLVSSRTQSLPCGLIELALEHVVILLPSSAPPEDKKEPKDNSNSILSGTVEATLADQSQILEIVHRSCPSLSSLHFSLLNCQPTQQDQAQLFKQFPAIQQWGLPHSDILPSTFLSLQAYVNNVTSLELACSYGSIAPLTLHEYLCKSPQLRHLWTHNMMFPAEYLDLEALAENKAGYYSPRNCNDHSSSPPSSPSLAKAEGPKDTVKQHLWLLRRVWACRNLETLQIKVGGLSGDARTARNSRVMFAYFSVVCPRLRDLSITRSMMHVELESGLCYLGAMEELEKLTLQSTHFWVKYVSDLEWIQKSSSVAAEAAEAAAAAKRARTARPSAMTFGGRRSSTGRAMSKSISRTTTRSTMASGSMLQFKRSKTRASVESGRKSNIWRRVMGKILGKSSGDIFGNRHRGEDVIKRTRASSLTTDNPISPERAEEAAIIERLLSMYKPESVTRFLERMERRKLRAEARENRRHEDDEEGEVGYCWPEMEMFVMDAAKYSGVSSRSLGAIFGKLRPEITFRAFS
ncbi:hypothetical protein EDD21DRAFT_95362 [Dissophora ornata]|nr:hypothetical protein EDD21DRAFT_95362 [Dissophora ornata]